MQVCGHISPSQPRLTYNRAAELTAGILCGNLPSVLAFIKYLKDRKQPRGTLTLVPSLPESKGVEKQPPSSDDIPDLIFLEDARKEIVWSFASESWTLLSQKRAPTLGQT